MIKNKHIAFLAFLLFSFGNHLFAQENPDTIALVDDQLENNFYEAVKQRGIENYDKAIVAIQKCIEKEPKMEDVLKISDGDISNIENIISKDCKDED